MIHRDEACVCALFVRACIVCVRARLLCVHSCWVTLKECAVLCAISKGFVHACMHACMHAHTHTHKSLCWCSFCRYFVCLIHVYTSECNLFKSVSHIRVNVCICAYAWLPHTIKLTCEAR